MSVFLGILESHFGATEINRLFLKGNMMNFFNSKIFIAFVLTASSLAVQQASAAQVCTEVTRPTGQVVISCKNVPEEPVVVAPKPRPVRPAAPAKPSAISPVESGVKPLQTSTSSSVNFKDLNRAAATASAIQIITPETGKSALNLSLASSDGIAAVGLAFSHKTVNAVYSAGYSKSSGGADLVLLSAGFQF